MSVTRLALLQLVLGAWLAVSGMTIAAAVISFREAPSVAEVSTGGGPARAQAMRFNVAMFRASGRLQLVLAGLAVLLAATGRGPALRGAMICLVGAALLTAVLELAVQPRLAATAGPWIERTERGELGERSPDERERFARQHRIYGLLGLAKSLLVVAGSLAALKAARSEREAEHSVAT